jgi:8-oxo-dGTP diphosphatase
MARQHVLTKSYEHRTYGRACIYCFTHERTPVVGLFQDPCPGATRTHAPHGSHEIAGLSCRACTTAIQSDLISAPCPQARVRVGLATLIFRGGEVLLHRRGNTIHRPGCWASPGGHLEYMEAWADCAAREISEECGPELRYERLEYCDTVDTPYPDEGKHYITIFYRAQYVSGEARVMEPEKCTEWRWWPWSRLPEPLMEGNARMKERHPWG